MALSFEKGNHVLFCVFFQIFFSNFSGSTDFNSIQQQHTIQPDQVQNTANANMNVAYTMMRDQQAFWEKHNEILGQNSLYNQLHGSLQMGFKAILHANFNISEEMRFKFLQEAEKLKEMGQNIVKNNQHKMLHLENNPHIIMEAEIGK